LFTEDVEITPQKGASPDMIKEEEMSGACDTVGRNRNKFLLRSTCLKPGCTREDNIKMHIRRAFCGM
jgi:hypothetical protein